MTVKKCCLLIVVLSLTACATKTPDNTENICSVFREYPEWYWAASDAQSYWHIPISVQMAIIHQESHFVSTAKPPREKLLGIFPWKRPSTSYGYSQALKTTWDNYRKQRGGNSASRLDFADATDFIGWYSTQAYKKAGISKSNAYALYLAYHEGIGGYKKGTYKNKQWLVNVAKKVNDTAYTYHSQLAKCEASLPHRPWYHFWS